MYVVTVIFEAKPDSTEDLKTALKLQARNSLALEENCKRFDVSQDPDNPARFFLYEYYVDREAFESHLKSDHYRDFDSKTKDWIKLKEPDGWNLVESS